MTFTTALAQSINIPAVKTLYLAGIPDTLTLAKKMGLGTLKEPKDYGLSLALGAAEVRLVDLTAAFAGFANEGMVNKPYSIMRVSDAAGKTLDNFEPEATRAIDPEVAREISYMLSNNNARENQVNPFTFPGFDVAAKTGTTNESRDVWTIGYTPSIAIGVWAGNNNNAPMVKQTAGFIVAPMWNQVMQYALSKYPREFFNAPAPIPADAPAALRGVYSGPDGVHDILHWVNKSNPRGGGTSQGDGQYPYWEYPLGGWFVGGSAPDPNATTTGTTTDPLFDFLFDGNPNNDGDTGDNGDTGNNDNNDGNNGDGNDNDRDNRNSDEQN
jgi:membrane peptidoglycan carboxypeptidase